MTKLDLTRRTILQAASAGALASLTQAAGAPAGVPAGTPKICLDISGRPPEAGVDEGRMRGVKQLGVDHVV